MEYTVIARTLIDLSGGTDNITNVTHCSTRLRLIIKSKPAVDVDSIKQCEGVLGVSFTTDELQIILGKNVIPVYTETARIYEAADKKSDSRAPGTTPAQSAERKGVKEIANEVIGFVSASVTPLIPGLVSGGMLKVFLLLATLAWPAFKDASAYTLLSQLANVPFYFMPVFVAYGVSKKMGSTPLYAMAVAAALVYPDFVNMLKEGPVTIFALPVTKVTYSSTLLPALLIGIFACYCERFLTRIIPGILRTVLVGALTMALTYVAGIVVLGPLGDLVGGVVVNVFLWSSSTFGPVAIALLATAMPWLVMTGMHHAVTPFMVQAFADPGYDVFFRPSYILHNMAEGGACIGVALRTKNPAFRAECLSLAFGCIVAGVTEPALYGVNLPLKRPMLGIMAGTATGGVVAGLMGATAYVYGYSTILALPIFQDTMLAMAAAIAVDIIVAAIVTAVLGFEDRPVEHGSAGSADADQKMNTSEAKVASAQASTLSAGKVIAAPVDGRIVSRTEIPDETFASGVMGDGIGIAPTGDVITAPFDGTVSSLTETRHAVGLISPDGMELLIHVGVDTVKMNGQGFTAYVKEGDTVRKGQRLLQFDAAQIREAGYSDIVAVLLVNSEDYGQVVCSADTCKSGDTVITVQ